MGGGLRGHAGSAGQPKTKPFEIPTLHHCQHCPLPAGAWHGPSMPPARPLSTPAVSIWERTEGHCAGTALFSVTAARAGTGPDPKSWWVGEEEGDGGNGGDGSARVSASWGDLSRRCQPGHPNVPLRGRSRGRSSTPCRGAPRCWHGRILPSGAGTAWGRGWEPGDALVASSQLPASVPPCSEVSQCPCWVPFGRMLAWHR